MSIKLDYTHRPTLFGTNARLPDYNQSKDWQYALTKYGVDRNTSNQLFNYWQNHPFLQTYYAANSFATKAPENLGFGGGPTSFKTQNLKDSVQSASPLYNSEIRSQIGDPFKQYRPDFLQSQGNVSNFNINGDRVSYTERTKSQVPFQRKNPFTGQTVSYYTPRTYADIQGGKKYEYTDNEISGRLLNNAFISDDQYDKLNDQQRQYYGLNFDQAFQADPRLAQAAQGVEAAYNYRKARDLKGEQTGFGAYAPKALGLGLAAIGAPPIVAGGFSGGVQGGFGGALQGSLQGALSGGVPGTDFQGFAPQFKNNIPSGFPETFGDSNVSIFDQLSGAISGGLDFLNQGAQNIFSGGFGGFGGTPGINPNIVAGGPGGAPNPYVFGSSGGSSSSGGIFDTLNKYLGSDLGQLGTGLLGAYLGNREADEYGDRLKNAAESAQFNPYNAQGPGGGVTFNNGQATTYLSPAMQALANLVYGSAEGNIDAFNSYDPEEQAAEQFAILEGIAEPYRKKERDSLTSRLINQGVYNPEASPESPGYWQPRYLEDAINASRDKNLFDSYGLAQNTATSVLNRGIGSTNLLNSINYGPLAYAGLGSDLGYRGIQGASVGIPYIQQAAGADYANDSGSYSRIFDVLRNRVGV